MDDIITIRDIGRSQLMDNKFQSTDDSLQMTSSIDKDDEIAI